MSGGMMLTDEQVAEKTKRASEALLFLARNYGDGRARRQYHEISEALHEIDALLTDRAELVAKVERLRAVVDAAREGCDACHKYNGADYCCDCYHAGSGTHDALAALEAEVGE